MSNNTAAPKACSCASCAGATCKCGCQEPKAVRRAGCACGESCNCGPDCACAR